MVGRSELFRLVRECAPWPSPGRPLPILIVAGPAGSGKTSALRKVREITNQLHTAYVDVAGQRLDSPGRIVTELISQLGLERRGLRSLRFPRFLMGQLAVQLELPEDSLPAARKQMSQFLAGLKQFWLPADVKELAIKVADFGVAFGNASVPQGAGDVLVSSVEVTFGRWRTVGEKWWSSWGRPATDALLELHRMTHRGARHERQAAEETLMRAFLADLRGGYAHGLTGSHGAVACVALLDNLHTEAGQMFLELLVRARNEEPELADPLLVVAASGRSMRDVTMWRPEHQDPPSYDRWRDQLASDHSWRWFCPIRLRDLTEDETAKWARNRGVYDRPTVALVHGSTAGHPHGTEALLQARNTSQTDTAVLDAPDGTGRTLADRLLADLLIDVPIEFRDQLISCSAGRDLTSKTVQAALNNDSLHAADELRRVLTDRLWTPPYPAQGLLHPWLRRLLLLHLQARPEEHPDSWSAVHARLRRHCLDGDDNTGARYHALAMGDIERVVTELEDGLRDADPSWLVELRQVSTAPNRLPRTGEPDPRPLVEWTADSGPLTRTIARIVAWLWIQSDPLVGAQPALARAAAHHLIDLGGLVPRLSDDLFAMADECRRKSEPYDV